jgi:hypothetical protein
LNSRAVSRGLDFKYYIIKTDTHEIAKNNDIIKMENEWGDSLCSEDAEGVVKAIVGEWFGACFARRRLWVQFPAVLN